jgi:hypothetical protein
MGPVDVALADEPPQRVRRLPLLQVLESKVTKEQCLGLSVRLFLIRLQAQPLAIISRPPLPRPDIRTARAAPPGHPNRRKHADNNLPPKPQPRLSREKASQPTPSTASRQRPARRPSSGPGRPPLPRYPSGPAPGQRRAQDSRIPLRTPRQAGHGRRKPSAAPQDGTAWPEPGPTIPIGLDLFYNWFRPLGFRCSHAVRKRRETTGTFRTMRTRDRAGQLQSRPAHLPVHDRYIRSSALPHVRPGNRAPDQHPLDFARALEDGEDPGGRGSFRRSAACMGPWHQHGFSTRCPR